MKLRSFFFAIISVFTIVTMAGAQSTPDRKDLFEKLAKASKSKKVEDREKAYQLGKEFLAKFGKEDSDEVRKVRAYVLNISKAVLDDAITRGDVVAAFGAGEYVLEFEPNNPNIFMGLAFAGFQNLAKTQDKSFNTDTIDYDKSALKELDANQNLASYAPFNTRDEAFANMNYVLGYIYIGSDMRLAAIYLQKAVSFDSKLKLSAFPYMVMASYYETAYNKRASEAKLKTGLTQAQMDAEFKVLDSLLVLMVDAYARTVKVAEAENNPELATFRNTYTTLYKFWKKSDAGSDAFLANALSTPMPTIE